MRDVCAVVMMAVRFFFFKVLFRLFFVWVHLSDVWKQQPRPPQPPADQRRPPPALVSSFPSPPSPSTAAFSFPSILFFVFPLVVVDLPLSRVVRVVRDPPLPRGGQRTANRPSSIRTAHADAHAHARRTPRTSQQPSHADEPLATARSERTTAQCTLHAHTAADTLTVDVD